MRDALETTVHKLPEDLWKSLTWDQGKEVAEHAQFTNGLLRQYFPKGTVLSKHTQHVLDQAAYSLNTRPRQTLGDMTPSDKLAEVLQ